VKSSELIKLDEIIRREIAEKGPMPFARFMGLALYQPELGYYERDPQQVGRLGDFYTSVSVGSLFGELLGFQFAVWMESLAATDANWTKQVRTMGAWLRTSLITCSPIDRIC
jgi:SAM-dependent MidA family methyltransferase